jgi:hypothetical protein
MAAAGIIMTFAPFVDWGIWQSSFSCERVTVTTITFLIIGIIVTGILFAFTLVLNQNHTALTQQQPTSISFQIDGFSNNPRDNTYILYL